MTKNLLNLCKELLLLASILFINNVYAFSTDNNFHVFCKPFANRKPIKKVDSNLCFYRFGIKVNVLSNYGLGMEFPVSKRSSLELFARTYSINLPMNTDVSRTNLRVNYKVHLSMHNGIYPVSSMFFTFGWNLKARTEEGWTHQNLYTIESYMADMAVLGIGVRQKIFEFWIAGERALNIRYNTYSKSYDRISYNTVDLDNAPLKYSISAGLAFYLIQSNAIKK
jgi:hypothetical protein